MPNRLNEHKYDKTYEKFFFKESLLFETQDNSEWLLTFDGRAARLYYLTDGKFAGDRRAELCGTLHVGAEEYFEFLNDRNLAMVKFARQLLFEEPVTDADQAI